MKTSGQQSPGGPGAETGNSWQFRFLIAVIALGVLAVIGKALGLY
jgi:hypothetical protein